MAAEHRTEIGAKIAEGYAALQRGELLDSDSVRRVMGERKTSRLSQDNFSALQCGYDSTSYRTPEKALSLSEEERAELACSLIDSLDKTVDPGAQEAWDGKVGTDLRFHSARRVSTEQKRA